MMEFRYRFDRDFLCVLLFMGIMLLKPTLLGAAFTPIGMLLCMTSAFLAHGSGLIRCSKRIVMICLIIGSYYIYMLAKYILQTGGVDLIYLKAGVTCVFSVFMVCRVLSDMERRHKFMRLCIYFLAFWSVMYVCCLPFMIIAGDVNTLKIIDIPIPRYTYHIEIYFPFLAATGRTPLMGHQFLRLSSLFRECGITQLFYIWGFSECKHFFFGKQLKRIRILMLLGAVFCLSTAGLACLAAYFALYFILNQSTKMTSKQLINLGIVAVGAVVVLFAVFKMPTLGLVNKNPVSKDVRYGVYGQIFSELWKHPIFGSFDTKVASSGLTMLQSIHLTGVVGFFLYTGIIGYAFFTASDRKRYLMACSAAILTVYLSQPIYDAPLVFLIFADNYAPCESHEEVCKHSVSNLSLPDYIQKEQYPVL